MHACLEVLKEKSDETIEYIFENLIKFSSSEKKYRGKNLTLLFTILFLGARSLSLQRKILKMTRKDILQLQCEIKLNVEVSIYLRICFPNSFYVPS